MNLSTKPSPSVTACLIVRNEAEHLPRCLASLQGVVDEVVVVDLGSTDQSAKLAERHGARVKRLAAKDQASAPGAALALAKGDWLLLLEATETLVAPEAGWRRVLADRDCAYELETTLSGEPKLTAPALRLVPRLPGLRIDGPSLLRDAIERHGGVRVTRTGALKLQAHAAPRAQSPEAAERMLRQAQWEAEKHPENARAWADLAAGFVAADLLPEAFTAYHRLDRLSRERPEDGFLAHDMRRIAGMCLARLAQSQAPEALLAEVLDLAPDGYAVPHRLMGILLAARGTYDQALPHLARATALDAEDAEAHYWLGSCEHHRGRLDQAWRHWEACVKLAPDHAAAREGLAMLNRSQVLSVSQTEPTRRPETLSACLIVKDEAENLPRCLASLEGIADEIVVVDTGSSDDTVAIAERFGAKVGHFAWCDDFAAARNASLELATGDWILVIDADEELVVTDREALIESLQQEPARVFRLTIDNVGAEGFSQSRFTSAPRLFRRYPGIRFSGLLHETIWPFLRQVGWKPSLLEAAVLRHHGYTPEAFARKDKFARNLRMAERMVQEQGKEPLPWYHLASARFLNGDLDGATEALAQVERLRNYGRALDANYRRAAVLLACWVAKAAGRVDETLALLDDGVAKFPGYPELHYERGLLRQAAGDVAGAIADFEACLAPPADPEGWPDIRTGVAGYLAHAELAGLFVSTDRYAEARTHMLAACADAACPADMATQLAEVAARLPVPQAPAEDVQVEATFPQVEAAQDVPGPPSIEDAVRLLATGDQAAAKAALEQLVAAQPRFWAGHAALAKLSLAMGQPEAALASASRAIQLDAGQAEAFECLGLSLAALDQPRWADRALSTALELSPGLSSARRARLALSGAPPAAALSPEVVDGLERLFLAYHPTVSACLIVKDEAENLPRCLASLEGVVDEIVVVDTGSSDDTVAIAERFGAKVGHFAWCDDFSAARNASLELATGDWILVVDADDQLQLDDRAAWLKALRCREAGAYSLLYTNQAPAGEAPLGGPVLRLFQRLPQLRYSGRIHETVADALEALALPTYACQALRLIHTGHAAAVVEDRGKGQRNVRLAKRELEERPELARNWLFLGLSELMAGEPEAGLRAFEHLESMPEGVKRLSPAQYSQLVMAQLGAYEQLGRLDEAESALTRGLAQVPGYPEFLFERGRLRVCRGDVAGARADFEACLQAEGQRFDMLMREGVTDALPRQALAALGAPVLERTVPQAASPATTRDRLFSELERDPRNPEGFLALAYEFFQEGALDKTLLTVGQAIELDANSATAYHLFGLALDGLGQPRWAEQAFRVAQTLDPEHPTALECRLACREKLPAEELSEEQASQLNRLLGRVRPTLSACLIVKDEAENLPRCLASLDGVVDEIVVVDTGSSDDTVAIAERFGAKVGHFAWCDDFSAARNASLELATGDWILVIDADEEFVLADHEVLLRTLRHRVPGGYVMRLFDLDAHGEVTLESPMMRLFQRHPEVRFSGRLHESVGRSLLALGWPVGAAEGVSLRHHGYSHEAVEGRNKAQRNLAIARQEVSEHPGDPLAWFNLGRSHALSGETSEALVAFEHLATLPNWEEVLTPLRWAIYVRMLHEVYCRLNRLEDAESLLDRAVSRIPGYPEFHFERGRVRTRRGDIAGARADFEACLEAEGRSFDLVVREGICNELPRRALVALEQFTSGARGH